LTTKRKNHALSALLASEGIDPPLIEIGRICCGLCRLHYGNSFADIINHNFLSARCVLIKNAKILKIGGVMSLIDPYSVKSVNVPLADARSVNVPSVDRTISIAPALICSILGLPVLR
jgi:hypothetical protein